MSREAVLLQWERKVEVADSRDSGRFVRSADEERSAVEGQAAEEARAAEQEHAAAEERAAGEARPPLTEDATKPVPRRFARGEARPRTAGGQPGRRTITITGQPTRPRRRTTIVEAQLGQPDRIALWAFVLGLILVAVAAGTAHA